MTAAMNVRNQYTAGTTSTSRSASSCAAFGLNCVMGTASAVSIFVALFVRLCALLRISLLGLIKRISGCLYS
jgi:hypothetical protein